MDHGRNPVLAAGKQERRGHDGDPVAGLGERHEAVRITTLQGDASRPVGELECSIQDLPGQRGLSDVQTGRRPGEAEGFGDTYEVAEMP